MLMQTLLKKKLAISPAIISVFRYSFLFLSTIFSALAHPWDSIDLTVLFLNYELSVGKLILPHGAYHQLFFFLLGYSYFTMLCWFLLYSEGNVNWCSHYGEQYGDSLKN